MIPENELLFICTRKEFNSEHQNTVRELCSQSEIKWDTLLLTSLQHKVYPLVYSNLSKCRQIISQIPPEISKPFKSSTIQFSLYKKLQEKNIATVLSKFNQKSVDVMLVKGAALNFTVYQDCPGYIIGDIDLILRNTRQDVTDQEDQEDIKFFDSLGIPEWERFQHHDVNMNGVLPINFNEIWHRSIETNFCGHKVFIMSPEDMLLAACINSCRKRFFRLKSICDIAEIIKYYKQLNWDDFIDNAKKYNCESIAYVSLLVTDMTVGYNLPNNVLNQLSINFFHKNIIQHLINYLRNNIPLAFLLPFSGLTILGRKINPSLLLTLATYDKYQVFRKIQLALSTKK